MTARVERQLRLDQPWQWLAEGWNDVLAMPRISLTYGAVFLAQIIIVSLGLVYFEISALVFPLAGGVILLGPMLAAGLYEASRRLHAGEPVRLSDVFIVTSQSPGQLAFFGVLLFLIFLAWVRIATLLFALCFGQVAIPPMETFLSDLLLTTPGLTMLILGTIIGAAIAMVIFTISAFSVPMLFDVDVDVFTAISESFNTVRNNPGPMLLWAWLILVVMGAGLATAGVGLIIAFPLIGHATWHAYKSAVA